MLKAGIIGYGTLGKSISKLIESGKAGDVVLQAILVRTPLGTFDKLPDQCTVTRNEEVFFNQDLDIIIEAAGHQALQLYGEKALSFGSHLVILSVGALADRNFYESLKAAAANSKKQLIIPSAAIAGLDRIAAGVLGEIDEITLITRKPPKSWYGTIAEEKVNLDTITDPVCIFDGNARNAATLFPQNVNVSAALSLAGIGFEKTKVQVYVDPTIQMNTHTIVAKGYFGQMETTIQNNPFQENPKSSPIVAMSVAKVLQNLTSSVVIGV
ncbi:aspartate dehydrogenase [Bacillus sp. sid0103]|uniref:aspartate dehydrogenase n=1 Tax=Bacillus sp. sid0103 TaxID=2856337 RepID=UPI001C467A26|nr:aspartate dehydrogenase [Bacillus sp. sid0103]MBV7505437.1 aspartate dehydrogenase [Bacillus sp. sid0103]